MNGKVSGKMDCVLFFNKKMFTGIVEATGKIKKIEGNIFTISHGFAEKFSIGDSVALSGACMTIVGLGDQSFQVEIMEESRNKTIFGGISVNGLVNLERSAIIGARNSGHFVTGHIDECGEIVSRKKVEDFELFRIKISPENRKYIVSKGSVAVDGISFTISSLGEDFFEISVISHTLKVTNLSEKIVRDGVNLEYDVLGKYVLNNELMN